MLLDKSILLVDDDESIRNSMTYFFRKKSRRFKSLPTAEAALAVLDREPGWDAVISDFKLPGMDGITFLRTIKRQLPKTKTALITAYATMDILTDALRAGVHDFIPKPFKASMIADAIRRMTSVSAENADEVVLHTDQGAVQQDVSWTEDLEFTIQKVTHQMNNAFAALRGKAELGRLKGAATDGGDKFSEILEILASVETLNKELMSLGKALTHRPFGEMDVVDRIRSRTFAHAARFHQAGIRLVMKNADGGPLYVTTCDEPLDHILDNILINAIQGFDGVSGRDKEITVTLEPQKEQIFIRVADNGIGMAAKTLAKAGTSGFTTKPNGNGLGLFITERLCRLINAAISIESEEDRGTTVTLKLPRAGSQPSQQS